MATNKNENKNKEENKEELVLIFGNPQKEERCRECGRDVSWGSGWFVNRVPDGDSDTFLCAECEDKLYNTEWHEEGFE